MKAEGYRSINLGLSRVGEWTRNDQKIRLKE